MKEIPLIKSSVKNTEFDEEKIIASLLSADDYEDQANELISKRYGFTSFGYHFLLQEGVSSELVAKPRYSPVPNTPNHFLGLANIRSNIVPLYSLQPYLTDENSPGYITDYALLLSMGKDSLMLHIDEKPVALSPNNLDDSSGEVELPGSMRNTIKKKYLGGGSEWYQFDFFELGEFLSNDECGTGY